MLPSKNQVTLVSKKIKHHCHKGPLILHHIISNMARKKPPNLVSFYIFINLFIPL